MSTRPEVVTLDATWTALDAVAASLTPEQWEAQSLCPAWNMRAVLAHCTSIEQVLVGWPPGGEAPFAGVGPAHQELVALGRPISWPAFATSSVSAALTWPP
jgi:uncharacterized protein (TIGR03083 family)